jgi:hypothetical protein
LINGDNLILFQRERIRPGRPFTFPTSGGNSRNFPRACFYRTATTREPPPQTILGPLPGESEDRYPPILQMSEDHRSSLRRGLLVAALSCEDVYALEDPALFDGVSLLTQGCVKLLAEFGPTLSVDCFHDIFPSDSLTSQAVGTKSTPGPATWSTGMLVVIGLTARERHLRPI